MQITGSSREVASLTNLRVLTWLENAEIDLFTG